MHIEDTDGAIEATEHADPTTTRRHLRVVAVHTSAEPQRRRSPRRQLVMDVDLERRRGDRRRRQPGIDGLLRTVLSDGWP